MAKCQVDNCYKKASYTKQEVFIHTYRDQKQDLCEDEKFSYTIKMCQTHADLDSLCDTAENRWEDLK